MRFRSGGQYCKDIKELQWQPSSQDAFDRKEQFSELVNRGGAPPGNGKAASAANAHGPHESLPVVSQTFLPQLVGPRKAERGDWRTYYDNARGNVDAAIIEAARAYNARLISESEYESIDAELRKHQARLQREPAIPRQMGGAKSRFALGWPRRRPRRSPDREKSRERARMLAGSAHLPPQLRGWYTMCEAAVLWVVACEVKRHGLCDLSIGEIAARAGVCRRTVHRAMAEGVRQGDLAREERERPGQRNDTNVVRITSQEWLAWIKRGPIGCRDCTASESVDKKKEWRPRFFAGGPRVARILRVSG
jgi:hypothetical protein